MVHPRAERFLIESAYKRLAREYHPDVSKVPGMHVRMVEINEAYEILSNPETRRKYDGEYDRQNFAHSSSTENQRTASQQAAAPKSGEVPTPPDPNLYGIGFGYLERAIAGAVEWRQRKHKLSTRQRWIIRSICGVTCGAIPIIFTGNHAFFAPRYNPNPEGYAKYSAQLAQFETKTANVFLSRQGIYHSRSSCCGMTNYYTLPKWQAVAHHASQCSHCGHFTIRQKELPPPFGNGYLPKDNA